MRGPVALEPYYKRIRSLRRKHGLSQPDLFRLTQGIGFDTLRAYELKPRPGNGARPRWRYPSPAALKIIAEAMGEDPSVFPEYQLAQARRLLDEREVGLPAALALLAEIQRSGVELIGWIAAPGEPGGEDDVVPPEGHVDQGSGG